MKKKIDIGQNRLDFKAMPLHLRHFDGPEYIPVWDQKRLTGQLQKIVALMQDGNWRTLSEIAEKTLAPAASASAQLRHLRKERFGSHTVVKRRRGEREAGLFEYKLIINKDLGNARTT